MAAPLSFVPDFFGGHGNAPSLRFRRFEPSRLICGAKSCAVAANSFFALRHFEANDRMVVYLQERAPSANSR